MSTLVITDDAAIVARLLPQLAAGLAKLLPELIAAQARGEDREVSTREAAKIARCRPDTISRACVSGALPSRTGSRKTPSGAPHRLIRTPDLRRWAAAGCRE